MRYRDRPPPQGYQLVPEVAAARPTVSAGGTTWTFRLRSGFRFSDGRPVARRCVRAGDPPNDGAGRRLAGLALHPRDRRRRGRPRREGDEGRRCRGARQHTRRPLHASGGRVRRLDDDAVLLRRPAHAPAQPGRRALVPRSRALHHPRLPPEPAHRDPAQPLLRRQPRASRRRLRRRPQRRLARGGARPDRSRQGRLGLHEAALRLRARPQLPRQVRAQHLALLRRPRPDGGHVRPQLLSSALQRQPGPAARRQPRADRVRSSSPARPLPG